MRRIIHLPDKHERHKDIRTLVGYRYVQKKVFEEFIDLVKSEGITDIHGLGDLFDSGYSDNSDVFYFDTKRYIDLSRMMNGNFREVIGNHINQKMSTNPELYLISPNNRYKVREIDNKEEPVIKTPDFINIEGVNFYFVHYNWDEKLQGFDFMKYKPKIVNNGCKNVAYFHSDYAMSRRYYGGAKSSDTDLQKLFEGIDFVFTGHVHTPLEPFYIGSTLVVNCGSITNVTSDTMHSTVNIPMLVIDNGNIELKFIDQFNLYTDKLIIKEQKKVEIKTLRSQKDVMDEEQDLEVRLMNTLDWIHKKSELPTLDEKICNTIFSNPSDITTLVNTYSEIKTAKEFSTGQI